MTSTDITIRDDFAPVSAAAMEAFAEEMQGAPIEFTTVTTPKASSTWEIEGEDPTKEIKGVVVDDYEAHTLYLKAYSGENNPPDGYWIAGNCQYLTPEGRAAGFTEDSWRNRGDDRLTNRLVLFVQRPGELIPLRIDLSGSSVRPWRQFKQNRIVTHAKLVPQAVVSLKLEVRKYASGFEGSVIAPELLGWLPDEHAQQYLTARETIRPFSRVRTAPAARDEDAGDDDVQIVASPSDLAAALDDAIV